MKPSIIIKSVAVIVLLAAAGGASWYFLMHKKDPSEVLARMRVAMGEMSSYHSDTAIEASVDVGDLLTGELKDAGGMLAPFVPKASVFSLNVLTASDFNFDEQGLVDAYATDTDLYVTAEDAGSAILELGVENRFIDQVSYFNLNTVETSFFPLDVSVVAGKWYRADDLKRLAELESRKADITGVPAEDEYKNMAREVQELIEKTDLLKHVETLTDETVDGVSTYHYRVKLNTEVVPDFVREMAGIMNLEKTEEADPLIEQITGYLDDVSGEVWIGKKDFYLYKSIFTTSLSYTPEEYPDKPIKFDFSLTMKNSKFDEPADIVVPEDARDSSEFLEGLFGGLFGGLMGGGLPESGDQAATLGDGLLDEGTGFPVSDSENTVPGTGDADGDGLSDTQERFWGSNPTNPDTDGDGYLDGEEVDNGYNPAGSGRLF